MMEKPTPQILNYFRDASPEHQEKMRAAHPTWFPMSPPVESEIVVGSIAQSNTDEAVAFLKRWPTRFLQLTAVHIDEHGDKGLVESRSFSPDDAGLAPWIAARDGKANLYFSVNSLDKPKKGKALKTDIDEVIALHVDIDVPEGEDQKLGAERLLAALRNYNPEPSVIIASGGGMQGFWFLQEAERIRIDGDEAKATQAERYNKQLAVDLGGDKSCHNVDRIMRIPWTENLPTRTKIDKGRKRALAKLIEFSTAAYPLATFKQVAADVVVSSGSAVSAKTPAVDVDWEKANANIDRITPMMMREHGVAEHAVLSLELGGDLAALHAAHVKIGHRMGAEPYDSHSHVTQAIATALLRGGYSFEEAASVLLSGWPGNKHIATTKDKHRAIKRALEKGAKEIASRAAREKATSRGIPLWRDCNDKYGLHPMPTVFNIIMALEALGVGARLDTFRDRIVLTYEGQERELKESIGEYLDDRAENAVARVIDVKFGFDPGNVLLHRALLQVATSHSFDPVLDYLAKCEAAWDGKPRVDTAAMEFFNGADTPLNRAMIRKMLVASVARARRPGVKFDTMCVLESPEGFNKSSGLRVLYGEPYFSDQTILGKSDREQQELVSGVWGHESADLGGMSKAEVNATKSFMSRDTDRSRPAYGRNTEWRKRRCVLWGSCNDSSYLPSQTGNRRFWPLAVLHSIDLDKLAAARDQIWGEAAALESKGESLFLDESLWAAAGEAQEERRVADPWEDVLANIPESVTLDKGTPQQSTIQVLHREASSNKILVTSVALLTYVLHVPVGLQHGLQAVRLATVMAKLGWQRHKGRKVWVDCTSVSGFWMDASAAVQEEGAAAYEASMAQGTLALAPEGGRS